MVADPRRRYGPALAHQLEPGERLLFVGKAKRPRGLTPDQPVAPSPPDPRVGLKVAVLWVVQLILSGIEFIDDLGHGGCPDWLIRLLFGRAAAGGATAIAAGYPTAVATGITVLVAVTDRRLIVARIGRSARARSAPLAAAKLTPLWSVGAAEVTGARQRWHRLHGARVRISFRDGSWIELTGPLCLGRRRAAELRDALR